MEFRDSELTLDQVIAKINKIGPKSHIGKYELMYQLFGVSEEILVQLSAEYLAGFYDYMHSNEKNIPTTELWKCKKIMNTVFLKELKLAQEETKTSLLYLISEECSMSIWFKIYFKHNKLCLKNISSINSYESGESYYHKTIKLTRARSKALKCWRKFIDQKITLMKNTADARAVLDDISYISNLRVRLIYTKKIESFIKLLASQLSSIDEAKKAYFDAPDTKSLNHIFNKWDELTMAEAVKLTDEKSLKILLDKSPSNSPSKTEIEKRLSMFPSQNNNIPTLDMLCGAHYYLRVKDNLMANPEYWRHQISIADNVQLLYKLLHSAYEEEGYCKNDTQLAESIKRDIVCRIFELTNTTP